MPLASSFAGSQKWFPFPPSGGSQTCSRRILAELGEERIPQRPNRHYPRAKRRTPYRYPRLTARTFADPTNQVALVELALS